MFDILQQLIKQNKHTKCISFYLNSGAPPAKNINSRFSATLKTKLRDAYNPEVSANLTQYLETQYSKQIEPHQNIAVFSCFDPKQVARAKQADIKQHASSQLLHLEQPTQLGKSIHIGEKYNLIPLLTYLQQYYLNALVVQFTSQQAWAYHLTNQGLEDILELDNPFLKSEAREYLDRHTPTTSKEKMYSTGSDNFDRMIKTGNQRFINQFAKKLDEEIGDSKWRQAIVIASAFYQELIQDFYQNSIKKYATTAHLKDIHKPASRNQLRQHAQAAIQQHQQDMIQAQLTDTLESNNTPAAIGWKAVTDAVRTGQVETLFIKPDAHHQGYVINQSSPYAYPAKDSQQISHLEHWLVDLCLKNGSNVIPTNKFPNSIDAPIMARLHYSTS